MDFVLGAKRRLRWILNLAVSSIITGMALYRKERSLWSGRKDTGVCLQLCEQEVENQTGVHFQYD